MALKYTSRQLSKSVGIKRFFSLIAVLAFQHALSQSVIINEVSQGPAGSQEYVEFLVTGPDLVSCNDTPPCLDLRGYIFDDNNGFLNGAPTSGVGIASGACRFSNDIFWSCIPAGTIIVVYNDADLNGSIPPQDVSMTDGNCQLNIPVSSVLFERHTTLPSSSSSLYSTTGWISGGSWTPISMANTADGFQIYAPTNTTTPVFSIGWGSANNLGDIFMGSGSAAGSVFYANDCNYFNQGSWIDGAASTSQTPGLFNQSQACAGLMNANCDPPSITITPVDETCSGVCDGSATVTVTGGTSPFEYTWSPAPGAGQGTASASGLCSGIYTLTFTNDNGNGCTLTENVNIAAGTACCAMTNTEAFTNATCAGSGDGTITLTQTAGVGTVTFSINGGITSQLTGNFTALSPGSYDILIEDDLGCTYTSTITIADGPAVVTPTFTAVAAICSGDALAALPTTSLNGITGSWSPAIDNTLTTTYTFTPDANQCAVSTTETITVNPVITPTFPVVAPICSGDLLAALPTTSTNGVNGTWSPSLDNTITTTYTFTPTGQCEIPALLTITVNPVFNSTQNYAVCAGADYTYPDGTTSSGILVNESHTSSLTSLSGCDSIITTSLTVINVIQTSENINLCSGDSYTFPDGTTHTNITADESYISTLTAVSGCDSVITTTVFVYPDYTFVQNVAVCENETLTFPDGSNQLITATVSYVSNLLSMAGCDSIITTNVTMIPAYSVLENVSVCENSNYIFPDGTTQLITTSMVYTSTLVSVSGCDSIITTTITMNQAYTETENIILCEGSDYTFPDGTTHTSIVLNETHVSGFTTSAGCDSLITTNIQVQPLPAVIAGSDQLVCNGASVTLSASGAATYSWTGGITNGVPFIPSQASSIYTVTGTDNFGCENTDDVQVDVSSALLPVFIADRTTGCAPLTVTFDNQTTGATNCEWNFGDGSTAVDCNGVYYTYTNSGTFDVTLTVTDNAGCIFTNTLTDYIVISDVPDAGFYADQYTLSELDAEVLFMNNSSGESWYEWNFGDASAMEFSENTSHVFSTNTDVDLYQVRLVVGNDENCTDTAYVEITLTDEILFYVPNVFTPDGDDFNENFQPVFVSGFDPYDYHLMIFNRWGEVVFESYNATIGWSGTYSDQGMTKDDVYVWKIEFRETMSDKRHEHYGHVTILK